MNDEGLELGNKRGELVGCRDEKPGSGQQEDLSKCKFFELIKRNVNCQSSGHQL